MMSPMERITIDPAICHGQPTLTLAQVKRLARGFPLFRRPRAHGASCPAEGTGSPGS